MWIGGLSTSVIINMYGNSSVWLNLAWKHFGRAFSHWLKLSCLKIPLDLGVKGYLQHCDRTLFCSPHLVLLFVAVYPLQLPQLLLLRFAEPPIGWQWMAKPQKKFRVTVSQLQFGTVFQHKFNPDKVNLLDKRKMWPLIASTDSDRLIFLENLYLKTMTNVFWELY